MPTIVQQSTGNQGFGTSCSATVSAVTSGNAIIALIKLPNSSTGVSVTDNQSNTYTLTTSGASNPIDADSTSYIYHKVNITNGPVTITANWTGSSGADIFVFELSGLNNSSPVGQTGRGASSSSVSPNEVTLTTATANEAAFGLIDFPANITLTPHSGYSVTPTQPQYTSIVYDNDVGAAGAKAIGGTTAGATYAIVAATYQAVSGTSYTLTAAQGSYALTGQNSNLLYSRIMPAAQGSYALTGQIAGLSYSTASVLLAAQGSYSLIGSDALIDTSFNADTGFYTLTGFAANLVYTPLNSYNLTAAQGSYTLTGFAANLFENRVLLAVQGQYNLTGQFNTMTWSGAPVVTGGFSRSMNISKLRIGL